MSCNAVTWREWANAKKKSVNAFAFANDLIPCFHNNIHFIFIVHPSSFTTSSYEGVGGVDDGGGWDVAGGMPLENENTTNRYTF